MSGTRFQHAFIVIFGVIVVVLTALASSLGAWPTAGLVVTAALAGISHIPWSPDALAQSKLARIFYWGSYISGALGFALAEFSKGLPTGSKAGLALAFAGIFSHNLQTAFSAASAKLPKEVGTDVKP